MNIILMASLLQLFIFLHSLCLLICSTASNEIPQHYVVYMGSSSNGRGGGNADVAEIAHLRLLSSIIPRGESERISLLQCYNHAFKGFSAMLTKTEASILSGHDEIVSIFSDSILKLHTTRSWDFLEEESSSSSNSESESAAAGGIGLPPIHHPGPHHFSTDVIIGVIDTGIWPESPSFNDEGIGEIPSRWKGVCMEGSAFKKSNCNKKLIGARYYTQPKTKNNITVVAKLSTESPRDYVGHGTHTTSIAAGVPIPNSSYYGLAGGTAKGGSPSARIATYKACSEEGCSGSVILKAIDDAVKDGVDIISISIGIDSIFQSGFLDDPIAIGAFHAEQMGVMVICSAGNEGPYSSTVVNTAPWIFTVAASSIDRDFSSTIILGNGKTFQGSAINFSNLKRRKTYPIGFGENVASKFTSISEARSCYPGSLDSRRVKGKIVVCIDDSTTSRKIKKLVVEDAKANGLILISDEEKGFPFDSGVFPFTEVGIISGSQILKYINSTKNPTATILAAVEVRKFRPAPVVAYFSSRGPGGLTENILKPDILAPGVAILASVIPKGEKGSVPVGQKASPFGIKSGTSMACPHISGAASFIKSVHHGWTSSMIKSALMTTATISNNMGKPLTNSSSYLASLHEMGVGELNPFRALDPGLVLETTMQDYLNFLCYYGYSKENIRSMSNTSFTCSKNSVGELISSINYPSISIAKLSRHEGIKKVKRIVTNVGSPNAIYMSSVSVPPGLVVKVSPKKIIFTENLRKSSFEVSFYGEEALKGYNFGAITWYDGLHAVRIAFAVNVE